MSHFQSDEQVVIIGSYCDQYHCHGGQEKSSIILEYSGYTQFTDPTDPEVQPDDCTGSDDHCYTVLFEDGGTCSWYYERQLTLVDIGGEHEIKRIEDARAKRENEQVNLEWIVKNWKSIRDAPPYAVANFLMGLVGINNPWGSRGEGMAYYANWMQTFELLDPILIQGEVELVLAFLKKVKSLSPFDVQLG